MDKWLTIPQLPKETGQPTPMLGSLDGGVGLSGRAKGRNWDWPKVIDTIEPGKNSR